MLSELRLYFFLFITLLLTASHIMKPAYYRNYRENALRKVNLVAAAKRGDCSAILAAVFGDRWVLKVALVRILAEDTKDERCFYKNRTFDRRRDR